MCESLTYSGSHIYGGHLKILRPSLYIAFSNCRCPLSDPDPLYLPEEERKLFEHYKCRQSISSIEAILKDDPLGPLRINTGDLALTLENVYAYQSCGQAWAEFPAGHLRDLSAYRVEVMPFNRLVAIFCCSVVSSVENTFKICLTHNTPSFHN
jgi:hypothetical protein